MREVLLELCHCARWDLARHEGGTVFHLLSSLFLERADTLSPEYVPSPSWLETRTRKVTSESVLDFCRELTLLKRTTLEAYDRKPVLSLIKECFPQPGQSPPASSRREEPSDSERERRLIMQRRRNGSL